MVYTTVQDVRNVMTKLPSSVTDPMIELHIEKAEGLIDGLLGSVFVVPFENTPKLIKLIATDLAVFFLSETLYTSNSPNMDEYQQKRYARSLELLDRIATGEIIIEIPIPATQESGFASTNDRDSIFDLDKPEW